MSWGTSASHIPVLVALAKQYDVTRVLEVGSGELSTPLFLNKEIFPRLQLLVSVESDPVWFSKIGSLVGNDSRVEFKTTVPASLFGYDLIFVDGPQDEIKRFKTIHYVMKDILSSIIVIHDIENKIYIKGINNIYYDFRFTYTKPWTGIYSKDPLPIDKFKRLNKLIQRNFSNIEEDWTKWKPLLQQSK